MFNACLSFRVVFVIVGCYWVLGGDNVSITITTVVLESIMVINISFDYIVQITTDLKRRFRT